MDVFHSFPGGISNVSKTAWNILKLKAQTDWVMLLKYDRVDFGLWRKVCVNGVVSPNGRLSISDARPLSKYVLELLEIRPDDILSDDCRMSFIVQIVYLIISRKCSQDYCMQY